MHLCLFEKTDSECPCPGGMSAGSREERAAGALLGVLIGDALGMGYQWYYDLSLKDRDVGEWVSGYIDPSPERADFFGYISKYRYEQGLRAGDTSQLGQVPKRIAVVGGVV